MHFNTFSESLINLANLFSEVSQEQESIIEYSLEELKNFDVSEEELFDNFENYVLANCILQALKGEYQLTINTYNSIFNYFDKFCIHEEKNKYIENILTRICIRNNLIYVGVVSKPSLNNNNLYHLIRFCENIYTECEQSTYN